MKNILAATSLALFMLSPAAFAQDATVDSGGAAGGGASAAAAGALAVGTTIVIAGIVYAVAENKDDGPDNVNLGATGTTGTN